MGFLLNLAHAAVLLQWDGVYIRVLKLQSGLESSGEVLLSVGANRAIDPTGYVRAGVASLQHRGWHPGRVVGADRPDLLLHVCGVSLEIIFFGIVMFKFLLQNP